MNKTQLRDFKIKPETFFVIASLLIGLIYCVVIPYGAGFDEERHLIRIYYMSENHILPNFPGQVLYTEVIDLSYQRRFVQSPAYDLFSPEKFWQRFSRLEENTRYGVKTQSIYSPLIFLPQAVIGRALWWKFDFAIIPTIILQKLAGLLLYVAGAYVAIRAVPYGKWLIAMLALAPTALYQAATLNADGFTAAVSFAFIGFVVAVHLQEDSGIQPRSIWVLFILCLLLGVAKPGAIILLPLLLVLFRQPFPSKKWLLVLGLGVLLAIVANLGWWALASRGTAFADAGAQSISQQLGQILSNPISFLGPLIQSIILTFPDQVAGWVASFGYGAGTIPGPVYVFWGLCLVAALLTEPRLPQISKASRIYFSVVFLVCCLFVYSIAFVANYATGGLFALVKHGRYYTPFAPLFFLAVAGLFEVRSNVRVWFNSIAIGAFVLAIGWFSFGIYTTYYTYCGYEAYAGDKCVLPIYKNLEKEGAPTVAINDGEHISQTFTNQCGDLESVGVYIEAVPASGQGSLRFALLDDQGQTLATQDFPISEIVAGDYLNLAVGLPADYQNKDFELELTAVAVTPTEKFRFVVTKSDYYPGQLSSTGEDLLIHYVCTGP